MHFSETSIPDCYEVRFSEHLDSRGVFVKVANSSTFAAKGLNADFVETFYTVSGENVLRGMHLQLPPAGQAKLVYCVAGSVMDAALDLRMGSPSFGQFAMVELSADKRNGMYLPSGVAHGFHVRKAPAVMVYHTTSEHVTSLDSGIRWDSFGAPWNAESPAVSERDSTLQALQDFRTPFEFEALVCARRR